MNGKITLQEKISTSAVRSIVLLTLFFGFLFHTQLFGQARDITPSTNNQSKGFSLDKVVVGGGAGVTFGNVTLIDLSPTIGYKLKDFWLAGISTRYLYLSDQRFTPTLTTHVYGGGPFTQVFFLEKFLVHTEYEFLSIEDFSAADERVLIQSWLVGGGYRSQIGQKSFANFLILWDLIQDINSPYQNPILRINFGFGL